LDKNKDIVQVNIEEIIKNKSKRLYNLLPRFVLNKIRKIIHEDEVNDILLRYHGQNGVDFANGLMKEFNVHFDIHHQERIPKDGKLIVASNHPLGGFDGLALISLISQYRKNIKFPVNDFLMNIPNLQDIFIPINKVGNNSTALARWFAEIFNSENTILYFPAGICSRKIDGKIQDIAWKKTFVAKAKEYQRDILPVYFSGKNSDFFYNLSYFRKKIGIKANIEMAYLADEFFNQRNCSYTVYIGNPVSCSSLFSEKPDYTIAQEIRDYVYTLQNEEK
jgi:1-acyl-sn-glycerol-3-phosphate acyltransferase